MNIPTKILIHDFPFFLFTDEYVHYIAIDTNDNVIFNI